MNFLLRPFYEIKDAWKICSPDFQRSFYYIMATFFTVLATYPMVRTTSISIYMNYFGGKSTPLVWFYSIVVLSITIFIYNKLYQRFRVQTLFFFTSIFSVFIFTTGTLLVPSFHWMAFILFIWKEVYIVLLIHLVLGYLNESIKIDFAKLFYGLVGAVGSIGGILGGSLVHFLTYSYSTEHILLFSAIPLAIGAVLFLQVEFSKPSEEHESVELKVSPFASIESVKKYVFYFILLLALTQIVISLANFKFNLLFDQLVPDKEEKTRFLSTLYSMVNMFSLLVQILIIPYVFRFLSIKRIHLLIPIFYCIIIIVGFFTFGTLFSVAAVFMSLKGSDYSIFNAAKELLYFPLEKLQKTGTKYIVDMVAYRGAKGLISFVLIFFQSEMFITISLFVSLFCWILLLIPLLNERQKILNKKEVNNVT